MPEPLVSIVTIFLNEERFLSQAIESVRSQTYRNWELLLCDDGSTDGSSEIAREYAGRYPERIRYVEHPGHQNLGMSATRNLGLQHARGELVAFLDGDDVWLPGKLARQVEALEEHPRAAMVYGPSRYWHSWAGRTEDRFRDGLTRLVAPPNRVTSGTTILSRVLRQQGEPPCTCAILARVEAVREVGGFEESFRGLYEDQVFLAKFMVSHDVLVIEDCLDLYRQHPDSCCAESSRVRGEVVLRRREYLRWLRRYIGAREVPAALQRAIVHELMIHRVPGLPQARDWIQESVRTVPGRAVQISFAVGRAVIPAPLRMWIWRKFEERRA